MRIPRDISGPELCKLLKVFGYTITRQKGSHTRITTENPVHHHVTIPNHSPLRIGTLNSILEDVAQHLKKSKAEIINILFS